MRRGIKNRAKIICGLMHCMISIFTAPETNAQANGDFRTRADGNWNSVNTWEVYMNGSWMNASSAPNQLDGKTELRNSITVTADQVSDQITISAGAQLSILPGVMFTLTNSADAYEMNIKGTLLNSGMLFFSPGALMYLDSAGTYIHNSSIASSAVLDATQMHLHSRWIYRGNGSLAPPVSISGRHYGNLIFESSAGTWNRSISGSSSVYCHDLIIGNGVSILNNFTGVFYVQGDIVLNGSMVNGNGQQNFSLSGTDNKIEGQSLNFFDALSVQSTAKYKLINEMSVSPASSVNVYGILDCGTSVIQGNQGSFFTLATGSEIRTAHAEGIKGSVKGFPNTNFSSDASYEFNASLNQKLSLYNTNIKNLRVKLDSGNALNMKENTVSILGKLTLDEGDLYLDSATMNLKGAEIAGNGNKLHTNAFSSINFFGNASGHFIPASVSTLKNLGLFLSGQDLRLDTSVDIGGNLILSGGKIICGNHILRSHSSSPIAIIGGNDSSYVQGKLQRMIYPADTTDLTFPIGGNSFSPLEVHGLVVQDTTELSVEVSNNPVAGTGDGYSVYGSFYGPLWMMAGSSPGSILHIDRIKAYPGSFITPVAGSVLASSYSDSIQSWHSIGGIPDLNSVQSNAPFTDCMLDQLTNQEIFFSLADAGDQSGSVQDSLCSVAMHLKVFLQGYYSENKSMKAVAEPINYPGVCDTITISLADHNPPHIFIYSAKALLFTDGHCDLILPSHLTNDSFYIVIKHRNSLETWSARALTLSSDTMYDFSLLSSVYGNNLCPVDSAVYAVWTGDISSSGNPGLQDGIIDEADVYELEIQLLNFATGYSSADLNGDQLVELSDQSLMENNLNLLLQVQRP